MKLTKFSTNFSNWLRQSGAFNPLCCVMVGVDIRESKDDRVNFSKPGTASVSRETPSFTQPRLAYLVSVFQLE